MVGKMCAKKLFEQLAGASGDIEVAHTACVLAIASGFGRKVFPLAQILILSHYAFTPDI